MVTDLIKRLRKEADILMPVWAESSSAYWYVRGGGRPQRRMAHLLREAADALEALEAETADTTAQDGRS